MYCPTNGVVASVVVGGSGSNGGDGGGGGVSDIITVIMYNCTLRLLPLI